MYLIDDKKSAIKEVQRLLGINESGVYDNNTRSMVKRFQTIQNIEVSGTVNYNTFTRLRNEYNKTETKNKVGAILPFYNDFPYKRGDRGPGVSILNTMLSQALEKHAVNIMKPRGEYYSYKTENAVRELRKVFLLEDNGEIDEIFYERLQRQFKMDK